MKSGQQKPILLDGCTGEGGGQLVRLACALAAVTSQPIRIINVRGNRDRSPGLKAQHVSAIEWLATATKAEVDGLTVGSRTLEFRPTVPPTELKDRKVLIVPKSRGASALLIFQAVFPYLLYAGSSIQGVDAAEDTIEVEIHGSTNASFSPSYEYIDQVLLPTLQERFGVVVERQLLRRAWTIGPLGDGCIRLKFRPISPGQTLRLINPWAGPRQPGETDKVERIDVSIIVPYAVRKPLEEAMVQLLGHEFPEADIHFVLYDESGHDARMYVLAVAHSQSGLRWGRDFLYDRSSKKKRPETLAQEIAKVVTKRLYDEFFVSAAAVDEYLQDQLVVFQSLAEGRSSYWAEEADNSEDEVSHQSKAVTTRMRKDKAHEPFGFGSTHTTTARWVASELLPTLQWFNKGSICDGAGISIPSGTMGTELDEQIRSK
ncbi:RNA 3'-terminal phosphate cyclase [Poronia punctata]|nr:RNA 3'-terminal phosphate cyclase [Poronia punctata]